MASETEAKEERPSSTLLSPSGPPLETETQGCNVCYCWQRLLRRGWSVLQQGGAEEAKDVPSIPPATEGEHAVAAENQGSPPEPLATKPKPMQESEGIPLAPLLLPPTTKPKPMQKSEGSAPEPL